MKPPLLELTNDSLLMVPDDSQVERMVATGGFLPFDGEFQTFFLPDHPDFRATRESRGWWAWRNPLRLGTQVPRDYRADASGSSLYPDPDIRQVLRFQGKLIGRGRQLAKESAKVIRFFRLDTDASRKLAKDLDLSDLAVAKGFRTWTDAFPVFLPAIGCDAMVYHANAYESRHGPGRTVVPRLSEPDEEGLRMIHPGMFGAPPDVRDLKVAYFDQLFDAIHGWLLMGKVQSVAFCIDSLILPPNDYTLYTIEAFRHAVSLPWNKDLFDRAPAIEHA